MTPYEAFEDGAEAALVEQGERQTHDCDAPKNQGGSDGSPKGPGASQAREKIPGHRNKSSLQDVQPESRKRARHRVPGNPGGLEQQQVNHTVGIRHAGSCNGAYDTKPHCQGDAQDYDNQRLHAGLPPCFMIHPCGYD